MPCLKDNIRKLEPDFQELTEKIENAPTLTLIVLAVLRLAFALAVKVAQEELTERARRPTQWPKCPVCGRRLHSKGLIRRSVASIIGIIEWKRRVGRCPNRCEIGQIAPLDTQLGLMPYQSCSLELYSLGCLLAVFVPYDTAARILKRFLPFTVSPVTIWNWVQEFGQIAIANLKYELEMLREGDFSPRENMSDQIHQMPLLIGADGVQAPFRPNGGSPSGKVKWREVKIGILARLKRFFNRNAQQVCKLEHRRAVAVLGTVDDLRPRLWLESLKQDVLGTQVVVWLSDGGPGLWNIFADCFQGYALGILDFYHATQNLWKAAAAWLDGRTRNANEWFTSARHRLRHGQVDSVLEELSNVLRSTDGTIPFESWNVVYNCYQYLETHRDHVQYSLFKDTLGLPIGSGFVESACKWIVQQRFKLVGMRWSEEGFNNLLHLRIAWVNERFEEIFSAPSSNL